MGPDTWSRSMLNIAGGVLSALERHFFQPPALKDTLFFPSETAHRRLLGYLNKAHTSLDIAMFTLTDHTIRDALLATHQRGVRVRLISDANTSSQERSDILLLAEGGIQTVVDTESGPARERGRMGLHASSRSRGQQGKGAQDGSIKRHMHHKFVLVDQRVLLTGSYNFTFSAASKNCENLLVTDDSFFTQRYASEFETLWQSFWQETYGKTEQGLRPAATEQQVAIKLQAIQRGRQARRETTRRRSSIVANNLLNFPALR